MRATHRGGGVSAGARFVLPADIHDSPTSRAIAATGRQAQRARRAETVRQKQRAALLALLAQTMVDLNISMAELNAARRAHAGSAPAHHGDE